MSQSITRIGIDLAKHVFQMCAANAQGQVLYNRKVSRQRLPELIINLPPCEIVMEACASAHYWSRVFSRMGHEVKLIHPAYVRPYVKTHKNDAADAAALCEAAARPQMHFVQPKTVEQLDIQALHRIRERLVTRRTGLCNQIRGLLGEYGLVIPQGVQHIRNRLPLIIEDGDNELSVMARRSFHQLYDELVDLDGRIAALKKRLEALCHSIPRCQRLLTVPGVGPMVATAVYATMGAPQSYRNGRQFSAFLGLVPR